MCYEHYHICRFCQNQYECKDKNYICPTINNDIDRNMCLPCKEKEREAFRALVESGVNIPKVITLDDWENK